MADEDGEKPADQAPDAKATDAPDTSEAKSASSGEVSSAPKKKKKKKKKRAPGASDASDAPKEEKPAGPALGPEGWERPGFVLDFPKDPELDRLVRAFELGNYAFVREHAPKLAESASDDGVRSAAGELLRRIEPDPLVKILLFMSLGLFLFMVFYAYSHAH